MTTLRERILDAALAPGGLAIVTGPKASGKTVLAEMIAVSAIADGWEVKRVSGCADAEPPNPGARTLYVIDLDGPGFPLPNHACGGAATATTAVARFGIDAVLWVCFAPDLFMDTLLAQSAPAFWLRPMRRDEWKRRPRWEDFEGRFLGAVS